MIRSARVGAGAAPGFFANVADPLAALARGRPSAVAAIENGRAIDYDAFDNAAWSVTAWLRREGVQVGDVVGLSMADSALHLAVVYGLARLGAIHISLPVGDPPALRRTMAERFGASVVICDGPAAAVPGQPLLVPDPGWLSAGAERIAHREQVRDPGVPWKVVLSSGTTSAPKAILATQAIEFGWHSRALPLRGATSDSRFLQVIGLGYSYGLRLCMVALNSGVAVVLPPPVAGEPLFEFIEASGVTHMAVTPSHLQTYVAAAGGDRPRLAMLRELSVAGAIATEALRREVRARVSPHLYVKYGANEVGYLSEASPEQQVRYPETIGPPIAGVEVEIVDAGGRVLPAGETGIARFRGRNFPTGYFDNLQASARSFSDGWYSPGDLMRRNEEGMLYFMGRADDLMNYEGVKVYPADIEAVIRQHPAVSEAAAFAVPSPRFQDVPAVAVVLRSRVPLAELYAFCNERLGVRSPRYITCMGALPRNTMGKIIKSELLALTLPHITVR